MEEQQQKPVLNPLAAKKPGGPKNWSLRQLFGRMALVLTNAAGTDVEGLAENDGTLKVSNYGKVSTTLTAFGLDAGGEQKTTLYGKLNGTSTIGALNINANNVLRVELVSGGTIQVDPVLIQNAEGVLWDPGTTSASLYDVSFNIVNSTGTAVSGVNVGVDIAAGGALSAGEYMVQGLIIPANGWSGWYGPFTIDGDDVIRGVAGTDDVLAIHFRVRQVF